MQSRLTPFRFGGTHAGKTAKTCAMAYRDYPVLDASAPCNESPVRTPWLFAFFGQVKVDCRSNDQRQNHGDGDTTDDGDGKRLQHLRTCA